MKSQALHQLVRKIYGDPQTRAQFEADPEKVLTQFKLSSEEKQAVLQTRYQLGSTSSGSTQLEASAKLATWWVSPAP